MPGSFLMRSPMPRNCGGSASRSSHLALRAAIAASILRTPRRECQRQGCVRVGSLFGRSEAPLTGTDRARAMQEGLPRVRSADRARCRAVPAPTAEGPAVNGAWQLQSVMQVRRRICHDEGRHPGTCAKLSGSTSRMCSPLPSMPRTASSRASCKGITRKGASAP